MPCTLPTGNLFVASLPENMEDLDVLLQALCFPSPGPVFSSGERLISAIRLAHKYGPSDNVVERFRESFTKLISTGEPLQYLAVTYSEGWNRLLVVITACQCLPFEPTLEQIYLPWLRIHKRTHP